MENREVFSVLGMKLKVRVEDHKVIIDNSSGLLTLEYEPTFDYEDLTVVLKAYKGSNEYIVNSDVLGVNNTSINLPLLNQAKAREIQVRVLVEYLPYLATICREEGLSLLIQSSYEEQNQSLSISVALEGDVPVTLLEINKI